MLSINFEYKIQLTMLRVIILFVIFKFSVSSITVSPATVLNGQAAKITCTAGLPTWKAINLYRKTNPAAGAITNRENLIVSLANDGKKTPIFKKLGLAIKERASVSSKTNRAFTVTFIKTACVDSGTFVCTTIDESFNPVQSQPKSFLVVDNSKRMTLTAGPKCAASMSQAECNQCNPDDRNQVVGKVGEEITFDCGKDLPFPDRSDRPNTFKWSIEKTKNGINEYVEVIEKTSNRNPKRRRNPTTPAPGLVLILGKVCAPTESHKSTLKYEPLSSDNSPLKIKCEVTFRSGSITDTTEQTIEVCVEGAMVSSTTASTGGSQPSSGGLTGGEIAGIVIAVIAFIILVVVLVYFLWYRKRGSGDKYSASGADKQAAGDDYKPDYSETYDNDPNRNGEFKSKNKKPVPKPRSKNDHLHYAELELVRGSHGGSEVPKGPRTDVATPYAQIQLNQDV